MRQGQWRLDVAGSLSFLPAIEIDCVRTHSAVRLAVGAEHEASENKLSVTFDIEQPNRFWIQPVAVAPVMRTFRGTVERSLVDVRGARVNV
jgi:hypothetical protein